MIIIPTYNERENIEKIIKQVLALPERFYLTVVDDNSPDGTGDLVDRLTKKHDRLSVIHRPGKLGLGTAYIEGFKYALKEKADYILEMDADFSHDPQFLPKMLEEVKDCDLVIGSRYINGIRVLDWPIKRLLLSTMANLYVKLMTGLPFEDCTGGFKCFKRKVLENMDLDLIKSDGYSFQVEMNFWTQTLGFNIKEIPIVFQERLDGKSKMSKGIIKEALWMVVRLRLISWGIIKK